MLSMPAGDAQRPRIGSETEFLATEGPLKGTITVRRPTADVDVGDGTGLPLSVRLFITVTEADNSGTGGRTQGSCGGERNECAFAALEQPFRIRFPAGGSAEPGLEDLSPIENLS